MKKTKRTLADGRAIIYYDAHHKTDRSAIDSRHLPQLSPPTTEIREDPLTGEWVLMADHRQERTHLPSVAECPLCPTSAHHATEIPEADYEVVVFENRFPSLPAHFGSDATHSAGRAEVVAFTSNHSGSVGEFTEQQMELLIAAWIDRTRELGELEGTRSVFVFENRGEAIGVTLHHPHGQIYAYPFLPRYQDALLRRALSAHTKGESLIANAVHQEILDGTRIIYHDEHWVLFAPYASSWPLEVQLHPIRDVKRLTDLSPSEIQALARLYPHLVRALDAIFTQPMPYMAGWFQAPHKGTEEEFAASRLFLRLVSNQRAEKKLKYLASSETLMGAYIVDVTPERAAEVLRQQWVSV